jgi:hypothetical protein
VPKAQLTLGPAAKAFDGYQLYWVFGKTTPQLRSKLVNFWLGHKAIPDDALAWQRTFEVTCIILNDKEDIVGVSSVAPVKRKQSAENFWFYRAFIDSRFSVDSLKFSMGFFLLDKTFENLQLFSTEQGAPKGVLIKAENQKFKRDALAGLIEGAGFIRLNGLGLDGDYWQKSFKSTADAKN